MNVIGLEVKVLKTDIATTVGEVGVQAEAVKGVGEIVGKPAFPASIGAKLNRRLKRNFLPLGTISPRSIIQ